MVNRRNYKLIKIKEIKDNGNIQFVVFQCSKGDSHYLRHTSVYGNESHPSHPLLYVSIICENIENQELGATMYLKN